MNRLAFKQTVTRLLRTHRAGNARTADELFGLIYQELRVIAHRQLSRGRPSDTLNTTALVHEAYLKLADHPQGSWEDKTHFLAVAAKAMRHILVDYARKMNAVKRGGNVHRTLLDASLIGGDALTIDILDLDAGLERLEAFNKRLSQVVEMSFFGGLLHEEIAEALGVSLRTVERDWHKAKTFLYLMLSGQDGQDAEKN